MAIRKSWLILAGFSLLLLLPMASIYLNVYLYDVGRQYYIDLHQTRLDPLGLKAFPGGAVPPGQNHQPVFVFYGDSRAANWPAPAQITEITFINRGVGAQTSAQALGRFPYHVPPLQPQIILIQVGINDLKTIPLFPGRKDEIVAECKTNIQQIVALSIQSGAQVILTTIFPVGRVPLERRPFWSEEVVLAIAEVNDFIHSLESDGVTVFDTAQVLANGEGITDPRYSRDLLHLNEAGYAALNLELVRRLRP